MRPTMVSRGITMMRLMPSTSARTRADVRVRPATSPNDLTARFTAIKAAA